MRSLRPDASRIDRPTTERYWDAVASDAAPDGFHALWRRHSDAVNGAPLARWLPRAPVAETLKTDLFDEAVTDGLYPLLATRSRRVVGIDISSPIVAAARTRHPQLDAVRADVRALPFRAGRFDVAISLSTLDHFESLEGLHAGLAEIHRTLRRGGRLVITLDNPANPAVALRNALPFAPLNRIGLVPYYVGATCGRRRLEAILAASGFDVLATTAVLHAPRAPAVLLAAAVERWAGDRAERRTLDALLRCERLTAWPTRYLTGHFVAALAQRR